MEGKNGFVICSKILHFVICSSFFRATMVSLSLVQVCRSKFLLSQVHESARASYLL